MLHMLASMETQLDSQNAQSASQKNKGRYLNKRKLAERYGAESVFLTKPEVAVRYGVSTRTVDNWMKEGVVPHFKVGKLVRFRANECDDALGKLRLVSTQRKSKTQP